MDWARAGTDAELPLQINVIHYACRNLHRDIADHVEHHGSAMLAVDMVVIRISPEGSTPGRQRVIESLESTRVYKPHVKAAFVISRRISNAFIAFDIKENEPSVGLMETSIAQRVAHADSMTLGRAVYEFAPRSPAEDEIASLTNELEKQWALPASQ